MAEAMWESRLCLFDEAFHLMYTPEETRKNLLNGNDASGIEVTDVHRDLSNPLSMVINTGKEESSSRKQSPWDAVQEAFLDTFVYLLRNYRKYLVFPSKHNEGSYGGAGFRSKEFIESQRYDMRGFLEQLIGTQMFDNFITKRLYGSGEADVAFFDTSVDKFLKNAGMFADVDLSGRIFSSSSATASSKPQMHNPSSRRTSSRASLTKILSKVSEDPILQSAKVHRMLKTIVPPEPTGEGLPEDLEGLAGLVLREGAEEDDDAQSVTSANTRNSQISAPSILTVKEKKVRFVYKEFPSTLDSKLFGTPRPLPAAVIAEFDRQRKDAAQFKRKGHGAKDKTMHIRRAHATVDPEVPPSPEAATFTVFFMAFTALVGKELMQMAQHSDTPEKTILSTYVPTGQYVESDSESASAGTGDEDGDIDEPVDLAEKADIADMKADRPNMGGMFGDDEETDSHHEAIVRQADPNDTESLDAVDLQSITSNDELAFGKGEAKVQTNESSTAASTEVPATSPEEDELTVNTNKTGASNKTEDSKPRKRFHDKLSDLEVEEAKATGRAQLGLAFEMLTMMKKRGLQADPEAYQSLIDASGRVGDTKRATELLAKMHEDGIVADGTVYACLVSAFSAESAWKDKAEEEDLPEWANSTAVEMDWNKLQKRTFLERLVGQVTDPSEEDGEEGDDTENLTTYQKLRNRVFKSTKKDGAKDDEDKMEFFVTEQVERQIALGENLVEIVFPDILVDTENEDCPRCNFYLSDDDVVDGWTPGDNNDYTTTCPNCTQRFVPHFCVQSSSPTFMGSKGAASPLLCERLSPWVLQKEIRSVMSDVNGIDSLLDPAWREKEYKNAVLWWNLVLSCMRYRLPFTFLLQGSFEQNLIAPMPEES
uniref:dDENN domain-containing protein n=1 Tax=Entomoneis paludosa TaxID=265537 RepID=A0A7S3DVC3_9STRA